LHGEIGLSNTSTPDGLKQRVEARDRLTAVADTAGRLLTGEVSAALAAGDVARARSALVQAERQVAELGESLRIYQAELHAQADELAASQARSLRLLQRFSTLFAHMPVAALTVGPRGDVLEFNSAAETLFALQARPASWRFLHRLVRADDYQTHVRPAMLRAQEGEPVTVEAAAFSGNAGRTFTGSLHVAWLPADVEAGAEPAGHHLIAIIDHTETLATLATLGTREAEAREREALLSQTARLARVGGWALSLRPQQAWQATDQLRELLELAPDEGLGLPLLMGCCAPQARPLLRDALERAAEGEAFALEVDFVTPGGRTLRTHISGRPERDDSGAVQRIVGLLQDISRSHDDQRLIGTLTDRLEVVSESGGVGVWDWDLLQDIVMLDGLSARLTGLGRAGPVTGTQLREALKAALEAGESERLDGALLDLAQRGGAATLQLRRGAAAPAEGQAGDTWLHMAARAQADAQGRVRRIVGCAWAHRAQY